jgi:hypothetical protein
MKIESLRPQICSKLANELGLEFLERLEMVIKNGFIEANLFVDGTFSSSELGKQAVAKLQPDLLMDRFKSAAELSNHVATIEDTKPSGHKFVQVTTSSCVLVTMQRFSTNTPRAKFYGEKAINNLQYVVEDSQLDLFSKIRGNVEIQNSHTFICMTSYWDNRTESLDLHFEVPHPTKSFILMQFNLNELKESVMQTMTEVAEESILTLLKRLDDEDDIQLEK